MSKKTRSKSEKAVHVRLESPLPLRKSVLSTAIEAANMLTLYEQIMELRKRRIKVLDSISGKIHEINSIFKNMDDSLPEIPMEEPTFKHDERRELFSRVDIPEVNLAKENSDNEVEKLKTELEEIERKLKHL